LHIQAYQLHHDLPVEGFVFLRSHKGGWSKYTSVGATEKSLINSTSSASFTK